MHADPSYKKAWLAIPNLLGGMQVDSMNEGWIILRPGSKRRFLPPNSGQDQRRSRKPQNAALDPARHHPTDPSSEIATSCCASMANSIGSACNTSRQNPLTTSATASSSSMPRWRQ